MYVFNNILNDEIIKIYEKVTIKRLPIDQLINSLLYFANRNHYYGDIWTIYITHILTYDENPLSLSSENNCIPSQEVVKLAKFDLKEIYNLFFHPKIENEKFALIRNYSQPVTNTSFNKNRVQKVISLKDELLETNSVEDFSNKLILFYQKYGCGTFAFHKGYRLDIKNEIKLIPIEAIDEITFDTLIGYEWQKEKLINNTRNFCEGKKANNTLLYGDSGTGKSSSIKALLNMFYPMGLRMIEVYKYQIPHLAELISFLRKRSYRFIIYMDDLSFENFEIEYKSLKSLIEGGLEVSPNNVLIYATSNRRYLVRESKSDNGTILDDLHVKETMAEKLSLAQRFGLSILYSNPNNDEFKEIVRQLALKNKINITESELMVQMNQWLLRYGNSSGRTATQFITNLMIKEKIRSDEND